MKYHLSLSGVKSKPIRFENTFSVVLPLHVRQERIRTNPIAVGTKE